MAIIKQAALAAALLLSASILCCSAFLQPSITNNKISRAHHHHGVASSSRLCTASIEQTAQATDDVDTPPKPQVITAKKLPPPPFKKVMAANRAEISVRIQRAVTELNMASVAIYVDEDRYGQHRWGADESYVLQKEESATPISAYLDIYQIINIAKSSGVDAIHPVAVQYLSGG